MSTVARLSAFVSALQDALGWQVGVEKETDDIKEYRVVLKFTLTFSGKAWPDILRNYRYRLVVFEMVRNRLYELWGEELDRYTSNSSDSPTGTD